MLLANLNKFIKYYGKGRKLKLTGFGILSFIAGCLEFLGVALIYPFIMFIIQPDNVYFTKFIKIDNNIKNGLLIGLCVFVIFILKNFYIIFTQYIQNKFINNWKKDIAKKYVQYYIYSSYKDSMKTSTNDKLYVVSSLCSCVIDGFVFRVLNLLTNAIIVIMVLLLLLIKFPLPAFITCLFVSFTMIIQHKYFKKRTAKIANVLADQSRCYNNSVLNILNNIKELKILSCEDMFYKDFSIIADEISFNQIKFGFYSAIPPYIIEILIVSSLIIMSYILSIQTHGDSSLMIASFAIFVAALFRISPALNRIQSSIISINTTRNFVKQLNNEYEKCNFNYKQKYLQNLEEPLKFEEKIIIKNISFSYSEQKTVLHNINFEINKGDFIGIIGLSGAGKSTLADVITGLLPADSGQIFVDGVELNEENSYKFRKIIGYIPQQICVLDKTVRENVAFGSEIIDDEKVIKSLQSACLYDVIAERSEGIYSQMNVGSNGLSQGQKQRLAIARALYRDPEIILMDEATSALDVKVENEITEAITKIGKNKTVIAIAHRLSTLKACNKLVYMNEGRIIDVGTFDELSEKYKDFADLVKLSNIK